MRRIIIVLAGLVVFIASTAWGQSKPVVSSYDEPLMAPAVETTPTAGYDGGFFIQSKDGDYKVKLGARVDTMFYWQSSKLPDNTATLALDESADNLTFHLRRAQFWINPSYKWFSIFVLIGHGTSKPSDSGGSQGTYWVASGRYDPNEYFGVQFGYEDPQYDLMNTMSSRRMTMVDNPITVTQQDGEAPVWTFTGATTITRPSFGLPTQLGLFLYGNLFNDRLNLSASIGNGNEGSDMRAINKRLTYAARASYVIIGDSPYGDMTDYKYSETPALAIGVGSAFESDPGYGVNAGNQTVKFYNWRINGTADIAFRWRGFSLNLAGYGARLKVGPGAVWEAAEKYLDDFGYLATAAMFVIPKKLELQGWGSQIIREGPDNNVYEFGGGVNVYFAGHNAKLQLDYSRVMDYDSLIGANHDTINRIRAKMQLYF